MIAASLLNTKISIPDKWSEVTVKQYLLLLEYNERLNPVRMLSIFSGIDYETLMNFDCRLFETGILPAMNFIKDTSLFKTLKLPEVVTIGEKELVVPSDIRSETFGQKVMLQMKINEINDASIGMATLIPFTVSTYLSPAYYGMKYDDKRAEELIPLIYKMPITEAYPVAYFFLNRWAKSSKTKLASFN